MMAARAGRIASPLRSLGQLRLPGGRSGMPRAPATAHRTIRHGTTSKMLNRGPAALRGALLTRRPRSTRRGRDGAPTEVPGHVAAPARPVVRFLHLAVPGSWLGIVQFTVAILHATVD
jgi:hypothetical protein